MFILLCDSAYSMNLYSDVVGPLRPVSHLQALTESHGFMLHWFCGIRAGYVAMSCCKGMLQWHALGPAV